MPIVPDRSEICSFSSPMGTLVVSAMVPTLATAVSKALPSVKAACSILPMPAAARILPTAPIRLLPRLCPAVAPAAVTSPPRASLILPPMPVAEGMIST